MDDSSEHGPCNVTITEPFLGTVWLSVSRARSAPLVSLAISIERSWDTEIFVGLDQAAALADSLGGAQLEIAATETVDGAAAVLLAKGDRLGVTVLDDRISDVLVLGSHAHVIAECLRTAAAEGT